MLIGKPPFETNDVKTTYRKIRMNSYTFPENVPISIEGKSLITRILHLNPALRPSLDDILNHEFFHSGVNIPKYLPTSTLACAPSKAMITQFQTDKVQTERNLNDSNANNLNDANFNIEGGRINANTQRNNDLGKINDLKVSNNFMKPQTTRNNTENDDEKQKERQLRTLAVSVFDPNKIDGTGGEARDKAPDVWVKKWVDYSSKYGLGYLLSNGDVGVFFNDSTKIILTHNSEEFN